MEIKISATHECLNTEIKMRVNATSSALSYCANFIPEHTVGSRGAAADGRGKRQGGVKWRKKRRKGIERKWAKEKHPQND